ncbi:hypothetical protein JQ604_15215 [Bradyrhizobium jicamae]|uniref:hypothetical protein n=1 Tax=Bradyrhizobium jicamae TaxID=280332 RepID=UPI001BAC84B4|nr:hypothetical protein [Bradyrhizobium jicamae]MBR0753537.1 hypothetical protein [Bradyrhizobium jicamae]
MGPLELVMRRQWEAAQRGVMSQWVVYDHPRDHPDAFVARRWEVIRGTPEPVPTQDMIGGVDLSELRACLGDAGLVKLSRSEGDQPQIIEVWI